MQSYVNAFDQGLRQLGWTDGHNVRINYQYAAGNIADMRRFTRETVAQQPDVIFANSTPITVALHEETQTIPVVFVTVSDPVGAGLITGLSRPGGNITGLVNVEASMSGKWVELLNELAPGLQRIAVMFNPDTAPGGGAYFVQAFENATRSLKLEPISAPVRTDTDIEGVILGLGKAPRGGLVVVTDSFVFVHRATIISQTVRHGVPAVYGNAIAARDGGLLSYGASNIDLFRRAASYVDRILRGAEPGELPVEVPTKFEFVINLNTAKVLGLAVPIHLQQLADELIE